jgi:serine/threonine protein kinase
MAQVNHHENVVNLVGVVTTGQPYMLVISFCDNGDVRKLLREHAKDDVLTVGHKLMMCLQIVSGMAYLSARKYVHRDLAARNVLLDSMYRCKVADFGMARGLQRMDGTGESSTYYRSHGGMLPLRWVAPETMKTMAFTYASDVWAYGITVLEIFTGGAMPYTDIPDNTELVAKLENGWRAARPPTCPSEVYEKMLQMWSSEPKDRGSFDELEDFFFAQPRKDLRSLQRGAAKFALPVSLDIPTSVTASMGRSSKKYSYSPLRRNGPPMAIKPYELTPFI